jgi:hypothetical protein
MLDIWADILSILFNSNQRVPICTVLTWQLTVQAIQMTWQGALAC